MTYKINFDPKEYEAAFLLNHFLSNCQNDSDKIKQAKPFNKAMKENYSIGNEPEEVERINQRKNNFFYQKYSNEKTFQPKNQEFYNLEMNEYKGFEEKMWKGVSTKYQCTNCYKNLKKRKNERKFFQSLLCSKLKEVKKLKRAYEKMKNEKIFKKKERDMAKRFSSFEENDRMSADGIYSNSYKRMNKRKIIKKDKEYFLNSDKDSEYNNNTLYKNNLNLNSIETASDARLGKILSRNYSRRRDYDCNMKEYDYESESSFSFESDSYNNNPTNSSDSESFNNYSIKNKKKIASCSNDSENFDVQTPTKYNRTSASKTLSKKNFQIFIKNENKNFKTSKIKVKKQNKHNSSNKKDEKARENDSNTQESESNFSKCSKSLFSNAHQRYKNNYSVQSPFLTEEMSEGSNLSQEDSNYSMENSSDEDHSSKEEQAIQKDETNKTDRLEVYKNYRNSYIVNRNVETPVTITAEKDDTKDIEDVSIYQEDLETTDSNKNAIKPSKTICNEFESDKLLCTGLSDIKENSYEQVTPMKLEKAADEAKNFENKNLQSELMSDEIERGTSISTAEDNSMNLVGISSFLKKDVNKMKDDDELVCETVDNVKFTEIHTIELSETENSDIYESLHSGRVQDHMNEMDAFDRRSTDYFINEHRIANSVKFECSKDFNNFRPDSLKMESFAEKRTKYTLYDELRRDTQLNKDSSDEFSIESLEKDNSIDKVYTRKPKDNNVKGYICAYCNDRFYVRTDLVQHLLQTHSTK